MPPVLMRGDLKLSRYVWQATSEMSFDHRILNPCLRRATSEPPHPLKSEIAEVVICRSVYGRFYSGDRNSPRILGVQFAMSASEIRRRIGQRIGGCRARTSCCCTAFGLLYFFAWWRPIPVVRGRRKGAACC